MLKFLTNIARNNRPDHRYTFVNADIGRQKKGAVATAFILLHPAILNSQIQANTKMPYLDMSRSMHRIPSKHIAIS